MPPPPAEQLATRIILGPALRTQPDRRLVRLVREGYDGAFEEIVRRYRRQLDRFAAAIVGGRSEDVTQDALSKALLALRGSEAEIELRPWLYRIVRNTALNDLRDRPPAASELSETLAGSPSAAVEAERREEMAELMARLRALPEPQRAAIVMRELEGLSHEEIAAALGVSGGAARQTIYRARAALRDGLGILVPLPLLRTLIDHGAEAAGGGAVAAASAGAGGGAAGALKLGVATALIAGSVGAGVAIQHNHDGGPGRAEAAASEPGDLRPGAGAPETNGQGAQDAGRGGSRDGGADDGKGEGGGAGGRGPDSGPDRVRAADPGSGEGGGGPGPGAGSLDPSRSGHGAGSGERGSGGGSHDGGGDHPGDEGSGGRQSTGRDDSGGSSGDSGSGGELSGGTDGHGGGALSGSGGDGGGGTTVGDVSGSGEELQTEAIQDSSGSDGGSGSSGGSGTSETSGSGDSEISP
jgi:RNA polymerase sigma factor (sigma-70 family)